MFKRPTMRANRNKNKESLHILLWPAYLAREANPYTALLSDSISQAGGQVREFSARSLLFGKIDVWHIHWPDRALVARTYPRILLKFAVVCGLISVARIRGTRIVWTVHNIQSHERRNPRLERVLMWW